MKHSAQKRGFTLIELLVVIAIIGVLAAVILVSLEAARQKSRDGQRASQVQEVMKALELYYSDNGVYPTSQGAADDVVNLNQTGGQDVIATALTSSGFLVRIPEDPKYLYGDNNSYGYCSRDSSSYVLLVNIESDGDDSASTGRCYITRGDSLGLCQDDIAGLTDCRTVF